MQALALEASPIQMQDITLLFNLILDYLPVEYIGL